MDLTRRTVVKSAIATFAASAGAHSAARQETGNSREGQQFFARLLKSSNQTVARMLEQTGDVPQARAGRGVGRGSTVAALAAAYCAPESSFFQSAALIPLLENATKMFVDAQNKDGTLDAGNLASPPDTAFVVEGLATALAVLRRANDRQLAQAEQNLTKFLLAAGEALVTGGVHTPNHRWVICSGLARINSLFPAAKYVNRIDEWLGEGIYIDSDGQFEERSAGIYSRVTVNAFVTMSRLLDRPALLDPVRRNLDMNLHYLHPDGEVETIGSRRQDQTMAISISNYYLQYRYLAIHENNPAYAAVVRSIESKPGEGLVEGGNPVIYFLEEPLLKKSLPEGGAIPDSYSRIFSNSRLARIRRGNISATVYGGSDWPLGVASGLASNPTFFTFRNGAAVLQSVRMGGEFFGEGAFRSDTLEAGKNGYILHQRLDVPYYQPLPRHFRNAHGDYSLTPAKDFRFWSKLDFPHRPMGNIQTLDQRVTIIEDSGRFELHFDISGHDRVPFLVELAFRTGGELTGTLQEVTTRDGDKVLLLKEGNLRYQAGNDIIEIGPGQAEHQMLNLSGPSYAAHGATLRAAGKRVYITGFTPFQKTIMIRGIQA
jgi:hypothetical protein